VRLYGLDGCKHNAWVIAESDAEFDSITFRVDTDLTDLFSAAASGQAVVVLDVPIGLSHAARACDEAARTLLRRRHVCVFTPPCREVLAAATYEEAVAANRLHCNGVAISLQAFNIRERIKAVDDLITSDHQERVKEGHPEVVFAVLNGARPLKHGKDTVEGIRERMALLEAAGVPSFDPAAERARLGRGELAVDDIVDAAAMLLTANHVAKGTAARLRSGDDERDERGLLMQMWTPRQARGVTVSKSGVRLSDDFRDNLIIDCYHPDLATMRGSKRDRLRSENSEDALTWNVFKSLAQVDPSFWLPLLHSRALPCAHIAPASQIVTMHLWKNIDPPPSLRLHQRDEGPSEIDVMIETEFAVWFIEAKFKSDISTGTTNNATRDQIVRNLDVGSWYAGVRDFYFALLIMDEASSPRGVEILRNCADAIPKLDHRPDGMTNIKGIGLLRWADVAAILATCAREAPRHRERAYAERAVSWLKERNLITGQHNG
jgi:predicted RNase H-like nuclease